MGDHLLHFLKHLAYGILIFTSQCFHARVVLGSRVGVCYGMIGDNLPSPRDVVEHYKWHKIDKMRLYFPDSGALQALKGSNIELILDVPNDKLQSLAASGQAAGDWVHWNIIVNWPDVRFKYISVGNEVFPEKGPQNVLPAMRNVYNALKAAGLSDKIKVSTAIHTVVLGVSFPPSAGAFSSASMTYIAPIVQFLASIGSPLLCNVYPYFSHAGNPTSVSLEYALFRSPRTVVNDGNLQYQNLFDAMVDSIYSAMEKVGGRNVGIVISETGWPSNGGFAATIDNAASYNWNVINHVEKGTPKRPGALETYIFAMFNENKKSGPEIERNFGLFYPNRMPVYPLQF